MATVSDMIELSEVSDKAIAENLRARLKGEDIYTNIGRVLISVNPFKEIHMYGTDAIELYSGKNFGVPSTTSNTEKIMIPSKRDRASRCSTACLTGLGSVSNTSGKFKNFKGPKPPHIYEVANNMFANMAIEGDNQCVIISGESGAGKTVAAKHVMNFLAKVSSEGSSQVEHVKDTILQSNPLLEAFGNAKTVMNNNSSRFGKFMEIQYNDKGQPDGGKISTFLLEKSRVVSLAEGERNYHIFYQLLAGCTPEEKEDLSLRLETPDKYRYLNTTGVYTIEGTDDASDFAATMNAMQVVGIPTNERNSVLKVIAAVLHLGNIDFKEEDNVAVPVDEKLLEIAADLLSVDTNILQEKLTSYNMESRWGGQTEITKKIFNRDQAIAARDTLSKALFFQLFEYLVETINNTMEKYGQSLYIGVLDIYGFECFKKNGFEQFSINYVNEKLQNLFIDFTLKTEQEEYTQEGISWTSVKYFNNDIVCEMIESRRPPGIMSVLDDVCSTMHAVSEGTANTLMDKLRAVIGSSNSFVKYFQAQSNHFTITHYAGKVTYESEGFCEKNKDVLSNDLISLIQSSEDFFVSTMFPILYGTNESTGRKNKSNTGSAKIRSQAMALVNKICTCTPHYVRCVKPTESKIPLDWDDNKVVHQVRYLGLVENIQVRRAGFAFRREFDRIIQRYRVIAPVPVRKCGDDQIKACQVILQAGNLDMDKYQVGKTKLFLKEPQMIDQLEERRTVVLTKCALLIQTCYRGYRARKVYKVLRKQRRAILLIQRAYRKSKRRKEKRKQKSIHQLIKEVNILENFTKYKQCVGNLPIDQADHVHVVGNRLMGNAIGNVLVEFSGKVKKYSRTYQIQERFFILSTKCVFIVGKNKKSVSVETNYKIKRRICMEDITSITISCYDDNLIIFHCKDYDNMFETRYIPEILSHLAAVYKLETGNELKIDVLESTETKVKGGDTREVVFNGIGQSKITLSQSMKTITICSDGEAESEMQPKASIQTSTIDTFENFQKLIFGTFTSFGGELATRGIRIKMPEHAQGREHRQSIKIMVCTDPSSFEMLTSDKETVLSDLVAISSETNRFKTPVEVTIPLKQISKDYENIKKFVRWTSNTTGRIEKWSDKKTTTGKPDLNTAVFTGQHGRFYSDRSGIFCLIGNCTNEDLEEDSSHAALEFSKDDRKETKQGFLTSFKSTFGKALRIGSKRKKSKDDNEGDELTCESDASLLSCPDNETGTKSSPSKPTSPPSGPPAPPAPPASSSGKPQKVAPPPKPPTPAPTPPKPPAGKLPKGDLSESPPAPAVTSSGGGPPPPPPPPPGGKLPRPQTCI